MKNDMRIVVIKQQNALLDTRQISNISFSFIIKTKYLPELNTFQIIFVRMAMLKV